MRILVDGNIPLESVRFLRGEGHDVRDIRGTSYQGVSDQEISEIARAEGRLLITTDAGFLTAAAPFGA
jgi:predicted nuclease of predicted toxin-antitoxin system